MQFEVPQFENEIKLIGPFGITQFVVAFFTGLLLIYLWSILEFWLWVIIASILGGSVFIILVGKVRNRPMTKFIPSAYNFFWNPKIYKHKETTIIGLKNIAFEQKQIVLSADKKNPLAENQATIQNQDNLELNQIDKQPPSETELNSDIKNINY